MAIVVPDIACLREPNLLIPGKKPVGNVKVDWDHPLTKGLVGFIMPQHAPEDAVDLLGNRLGYVTDNANYHAAIYRKDGKTYLSGAGTIGIYSLCITSSDIANRINASDDVSVLSGMYIHALDKDCGLFGFGSNKWSWLDQSGGALRASAFTAYDTTNPITNTGHNIVGLIWRADNSYQTIVDGKFSQSGSKTRLAMTGDFAAWASTTVAGKGIQAANGAPKNQTGEWFAVWNRSLSEIETNSMSADPYQFLIHA